MPTSSNSGATAIYPEPVAPIFNQQKIAVSVSQYYFSGYNLDGRCDITFTFTCDGVTYTDVRQPAPRTSTTQKNRTCELDASGYLRAFFYGFAHDNVRQKQVRVKVTAYNTQLGQTITILDTTLVAVFATDTPAHPFGKPLICKYYPNIPVIQRYTLVAGDGDTAGYAEGAWAVYNQMAEQTYVGSFNATTANNYRAYLGVGYKHTNPTHKYLAAIKLNAKNGSSNISLDASASVGVGKGSFNQNIGSFKTNTNAYIFFTPKYAEYNYFSVYTRGAETAGDSFSLEVYIYDLTRMFGAGDEPTNITDFINRKPNVSGSVYNGGELSYNDGGTLLPAWVGLKDCQIASNQKDVVVVHREGEVALHRFIKSEETCGVFLRWIDAQGFIRHYLFKEGASTLTTKGDNEVPTETTIRNYLQSSVINSAIPHIVEATTTKKVCAVSSTEDEREMLDTIYCAPFVWLVDYAHSREIPVQVKKGSVTTARGLNDYEIEITLPQSSFAI